MTTEVFADSYCLTCEKPLNDGSALYCDEKCRHQDGLSRHGYPGMNDSPSFMASLPALLASNIKASSPQYRNNHPATASNSSHSETSSPLQSPSPFAQPVDALDASPKEESFVLPPPAYPNPLYHQAYQPSSVPVKIPNQYKSPSISHEHSYTSRQSYKESTTPVQPNEATLRYGRRPGQTNSVTSPMALFPIDKRRQSHGANGMVRPNSLVPSPALPPTRNISEPASVTAHGRSTLAEQRMKFAYGNHSPLLMATNSPRQPSYGVDFVNAASHVRDRSPSKVESSLLLKNAQQGKRTSLGGSPVKHIDLASSLIERRKSFPAQLFAKPKATKPIITHQAIASTPLASSDEDEPTPVRAIREEEPSGRGRSREKRRPAVDREDSREPSRSRSSGMRLDYSRERLRGERSGSSRRRSDRDRRASRRRERSRSSERECVDERIRSQATPIHNVQGRVGGGRNDLATIIGSLQLQDRQPAALQTFGEFEEEQEGDYQGVRSISPLATLRLGRHMACGQDGSVSPKEQSKRSPILEDSRRGRSKERTSRAAEKLQRLFEEGVTTS